jgi:hypothetical protein
MIDKSLAPIKEKCRVLGMGVAVRVSVSTFRRNSFNLSFALTPNFCSSSMINRPRSLNLIFLLSNLWVPMIISSLPSPSLSSVLRCC